MNKLQCQVSNAGTDTMCVHAYLFQMLKKCGLYPKKYGMWCQVCLRQTHFWVNRSFKLERVNELFQCLTLLFFSVFLFCPSVPLYQAQTEHPGDSAHSHRWTSLELVKGTYSTDDSPSDIAEIRLDKAVPLKVLRILHMNHAKQKLHFGANSLPPCCSCRRV